ncbi:MAG: hypothetical protein QM679_04825 [Patulibacter sp.]
MRVDLHCHLLPGVDDGPRSDADALALARALVDDGVGVVAATPHHTPRHSTPRPQLAARLTALRELIAADELPLEVLGGAEVAVDALLDLPDDEIQALRIGETGPLLVELPQREVAGDPGWIVTELLERGVPVLLAHPERVPYFQADLRRLQALTRRGAHAQGTAGAFLGRYGATAQRAAVAMLDAGLIDVLASDAHHAQLRPPDLEAARHWLAEHRPDCSFDQLTVHTPSVLIPRPAPTP